MPEVETIPVGFVPEDKYKNFRDVRTWLANFYKYCLSERKHLKTKKGLAAVEDTRLSLSAEQFNKDLHTWHTWLVVYMLQFNELQWRNIDLSTTPPPKLPDYMLLALMKHSIFCNEDMDTVIKSGFKLRAIEKRVLRELALRATA